MYEITVTVDVINYEIRNEDGFEIIWLPNVSYPGADDYWSEAEVSYTYNESEPVVPYVFIPISLPSSAVDISIEERNWDAASIGQYNVPSTTWNGGMGGFTAETNVKGFYPDINSNFSVNTIDDFQRASVFVVLAKFNPDTKEVILCDSATLTLRYKSTTTLAVIDFWTDKSEYNIGEPITGTVKLRNQGSEKISGLQLNMSLVNDLGKLDRFIVGDPFDIAPGESKTVLVVLIGRIEDGSYVAEMSIVGYEDIEIRHEWVSISSGEILEFSLPEEVVVGEEVVFEILFENKDSRAITATPEIKIFDNIGKSKLTTITGFDDSVDMLPHSTARMELTWDTSGQKPARYTVHARISTSEGKVFGPDIKKLEVKPAE